MPKSGEQRQKADVRIGQTVGNYSLLSVLGTGSTSTVYLGQRTDDPRALVAVKVLSYSAATGVSDRATFRTRFLREARAVSKLRNEHILPVLSYGDSDDLTYMVMPVIVGGTLAVRLAQQEGPFPLREIVDYFNQLADALDYAHGQGLVHRDVKPSNILLDEHGHLYLTDFGIARLFDSGENTLAHEGPLTRTGQILGTPYYMAPEQITGDPVGPATDVYAAGVVLYQLVTGQVPFPGDTPLAVALQHLQETPPSPRLLRSELPSAVADVILQAMAKDPADRYPSVGALAEAFSETLTSTATLAQPLETGSWQFATAFESYASMQSDAPASDLDPQLEGLFDELIGTKVGVYRIEHLHDANEHEARFVTRREAGSAPYVLRLLVLPQDLDEEERAAFLAEATERIESLAALDHPAIEQIVDSGEHLGMPYVISQTVTGTPLSDLLATSGALDPTIIGRYLDQLADALDYAHTNGALHLNVTADSIVVRDEDALLLIDFALDPQHPTGEACAPEQLLGNPVGPYTDVYGLGNVLYQMLTAHRVFESENRDELTDQHLNATIPPARTWRSGLPAGIENVLARAMAKEPEYRYATPRVLANAFRKVLARSGNTSYAAASTLTADKRTQIAKATITPVLSTDSMRPSAQNTMATRVAKSTPTGSRTAVPTGSRTAASTSGRTAVPTGSRPPRSPSDSLAGSTASGLTRRRVEATLTSISSSLSSAEWRNSMVARLPALPEIKNRVKGRLGTEIISIVAVLAIVVASLFVLNAFRSNGKANVAAVSGPEGEVSFFDGPTGTSTDALSLNITDLSAPPKGDTYNAWLVDDQGEHFMALGTLTKATSGWTLDFDSTKGSSSGGTNLLAFGNKLEVTEEQGSVSAPVGKVVMVGVFPPVAFSHIKHLMVSFATTPGQIGLLVGTREQGTLLDQQAQVLLSFFQRQYYVSATCAAQSVIDILEGTSGAHYQPLGPDCVARNITLTGDGFGLLGSNGYLAGVSDHATLASNSPDSTADIRLHATHVNIAITNVTGWMTTVEQDALSILAGNHDLAKAQEIATLADRSLHGVDINGNEVIEPIPGEAGIATAYSHAQLMAMLELAPPKKN